jgi:hypothetical protein
MSNSKQRLLQTGHSNRRPPSGASEERAYTRGFSPCQRLLPTKDEAATPLLQRSQNRVFSALHKRPGL